MVESKVAEVDGKDLVYFQALTKEEADEAGCPKSQYYYWQIDGKKIFSPLEILLLVQQSVVDQNFVGQKLLEQNSVQTHYSRLIQEQKKNGIAYLKKVRADYIKHNYPPEAIEAIDNTIKNYEDIKEENVS